MIDSERPARHRHRRTDLIEGGVQHLGDGGAAGHSHCPLAGVVIEVRRDPGFRREFAHVGDARQCKVLEGIGTLQVDRSLGLYGQADSQASFISADLDVTDNQIRVGFDIDCCGRGSSLAQNSHVAECSNTANGVTGSGV